MKVIGGDLIGAKAGDSIYAELYQFAESHIGEVWLIEDKDIPDGRDRQNVRTSLRMWGARRDLKTKFRSRGDGILIVQTKKEGTA